MLRKKIMRKCNEEVEKGFNDTLTEQDDKRLKNKGKAKKVVIICCTVVLVAVLATVGMMVFTEMTADKIKTEEVLSLLQSGEYDKAVETVNNDIHNKPDRIDEYSAVIVSFLEDAYTVLNESECKMNDSQNLVKSYQTAEQKNEAVSKMNLNETVKEKQEMLTKLINSRKAYFDAMRGVAGEGDGMINKLDEVIEEDRIYESVQNIKIHIPAGIKAVELINKGMSDYENRHLHFAEAIPYYRDFIESSKKIEVGMVQPNDEFKEQALEEMSAVKHTFYKVYWDENSTMVINTYLKDYNTIMEMNALGIDVSQYAGVFLNTENVFNPILQRDTGYDIYTRLLLSTDIDNNTVTGITVTSGDEKYQLYSNANDQDISYALEANADECLEFIVNGLLKDIEIKIEVAYTDRENTTHGVSDFLAEAICNTYILSNLLKYDSAIFDEVLQ